MQTELEKVRQARICITLWACAYEFFSYSIVSDAKYDAVAKYVFDTLHIATNDRRLDLWFVENFQPHTGIWVHGHPNLHVFKHKVKQHIRPDG